MDEIAAALLIWIAAHSPLDASRLQPPPIVLLDAQAIATRDHAGAQAAAGEQRVLGYFAPHEGRNGTIYVLRPERRPGQDDVAAAAADPLFRERLLHELVHFAQHATGQTARFECPMQGEAQAYALGGKYLRQRNVDDPLPHRVMLVAAFTSCRMGFP
jgi:hypothetical protein